MREIRQSGSEGGARFNPLSLPLSPKHRGLANAPFYAAPKPFRPLTGAAFLRILSTR
jgi:hypothetical protein